jgi:hypothetical protein
VNNIEMDLRAVVWGGVDWIDLAQDWYQCGVLLKTAVAFEFHKILGNS